MNNYWEKHASETYSADLFMAAVNHLVFAQALYYENRGDKAHYRVIERHETAIQNYLDGMGVTLHVDRVMQYVAISSQPRDGYRHQMLKRDESLLMAVLRLLYHQRMGAAESDDGRVEVDLVSLVDVYRAETGEDLPEKQHELRSLIEVAVRFGIARIRILDDDPQPFSVVILPGIEHILNLDHVSKLAAGYAAAAAERCELNKAAEPDIDSDESTTMHDEELSNETN